MSRVYFWMGAMAIVAMAFTLLFFISLKKDNMFIKKRGYSKTNLVVNWMYIIFAIIDISLLIISFLQIKVQLEILNF